MTAWSVRGLVLGAPRPDDLPVFERLIADVLPSLGCNTLVLLIRYRYPFARYPSVADQPALTPEQAAWLARLGREHGIRLIPKMNLFGHQSERTRGSELGLLRAFPEFDETPDLDEVRYCRSLCPRHPQVGEVVFALLDELIDAFQADAVHVGMDEVFEIGRCPRCRGIPNDRLFADWVNTLHGHIVETRGVEMWMWGDRLLDAETTGYGEWEASANQTWPAVDRLPRDIVICDWHYEERESGYPSLGWFTGKGFRTVACPWRNRRAAELFLNDVAALRSDKMLGVMSTSWCDPGALARYLCGDDSVDGTPRQVGEVFKFVMRRARGVEG